MRQARRAESLSKGPSPAAVLWGFNESTNIGWFPRESDKLAEKANTGDKLLRWLIRPFNFRFVWESWSIATDFFFKKNKKRRRKELSKKRSQLYKDWKKMKCFLRFEDVKKPKHSQSALSLETRHSFPVPAFGKKKNVVKESQMNRKHENFAFETTPPPFWPDWGGDMGYNYPTETIVITEFHSYSHATMKPSPPY